MTGLVVASLVIGIPALLFALWPLLARRGSGGFLSLPPDAREALLERKRAVLRALRELEFEHEARHIADDDYAELRARYEAEAAEIRDRRALLPRFRVQQARRTQKAGQQQHPRHSSSAA